MTVERLEDRLAPNAAPLTPVISEPVRDNLVVNPQDVHMETEPFQDPDSGASPDGQHLNTDWFIFRRLTGGSEELVWQTLGIGGPERVHTHIGDGQFLGSHAGRTDFLPDTDFVLRVRHRDASGDGTTNASPLAQRLFRTGSLISGNPDQRWTVQQPGFIVETVATGFRLPVNLAFVPNPGPNPTDPFYYVAELYGTIKMVMRNGQSSNYASNLLNYNPTGAFPGSGEQGLAGIAVDPVSGDVFASMVYSQIPFNDASPHFPRVVRFNSTDGGRTAATQTTVFDPITLPGAATNLESEGQSHQISDVSIGPDGMLYVHNGEGFDASRAQNLASTGGKILRMTLTGAAAVGNPFFDTADGITARDYVYASGFRNPFGGAWRAEDNRHYTVENGPGSNDRFSQLVAGRNYGWNGTDASMTNFALFLWNPPTAPVDIAFIQSQSFAGSQFPSARQGHAFVSLSGGTYAAGPQANGKFIQEFVLDANGNVVGQPTTLLRYTGVGRASVAGLAAGPDGLYFSDLYRDDGVGGPTATGANILRIRYVGAADFTANVTGASAAPLTVQFTDTSDFPGTTDYFWDFGDGTHSTLRNPAHTFTQSGAYTVRLTVTGAGGVIRVAEKRDFILIGVFGLQAQYFDNRLLQGTPRLTRLDPTVNFDFGTGSPDAVIPVDSFSARWTGFVRPLFTETYTFLTTSDDGVRLSINGQQIINNFTDHAPTTDMGTITLTAGQDYSVLLEWYENGGGALIRLEWQSASQARQIVPTGQLRPVLPSSNLGFNLAAYTVNENAGTATVTVIRTDSSAGAVSVAFATTAGGTAAAGADYTTTSGTLSWAAGDTSPRTFTVPILDDGMPEPNETINLVLSNPVGAVLGQASAVLTIVDNDPRPDIQVQDGTTDIPDNTGAVSFGSTIRGTPVSRIFTVRNTGAADLTLSAPLGLPPGFTLVSGPDTTTLAPAASTTFTVRLDAAAVGAFTGQIVLVSNDSDENPFNFMASGTVLQPADFSARIHFTTATGEAVPAYINDIGLAFGDRGGGLSFGWNQDNTLNARDRDDPTSPSELHDSFNHMQKPDNPDAFWEIAVPSGTYSVRVLAGDSTTFDSVFRINVEGVLALDGIPNATVHWFENTVTVTVSDGRLTVSNAPGSSNNKINAIDISPVIAPTLTVSSIAATPTGISALFNRALDASVLNLYSTATGGQGPADVTLVGASTGAVTGSLVVNAAGTGVTFLHTGGLLTPDTYTITLRSAANGFRDTGGALLDGNGDGTAADNYVTTFAVAPPAAAIVSLPEFSRGPGQLVNVPATELGIPLALSDGAGVTSISVTLLYNPSLLLLTGAAPGPGMPAGATANLVPGTPGTVTVTFTSPTPLSAGAVVPVRLTAAVPNGATYAAAHVLNLTNVLINGGAIAALDDDGLHVAGYLGDTTGDRRYSALDAQRALRVAVELDSGFASYRLTDPVVIADITGNGLLSSLDSTRVLQEAVGLDRPEIAPRPNVSFASGFTGATGLALNGSAQISGNALRLTNGGMNQAASTFTTSRSRTTRFNAVFSFQLTNPDADGFAFVLQGISPTALGPSGHGLGHGPLTSGGGGGIGSSVAVKFDLYNNEGEGINSTGLYVPGQALTIPAIDLTPSGINLHSGRVFRVALDYDGTSLRVAIIDTVTGALATQSYLVNIPGIVGSSDAFLGFTAGTGALTATQDILDWTFTSL